MLSSQASDNTLARDSHRNLPGDAAIWVFVLGDFLIFSAYFIVYAIKRHMDRSGFLESQHHLNLDIGVLNTAVLITSSWFVASAADAARQGNHPKAVNFAKLCGLLGVLFVFIKVYEWVVEINAGHAFTSSEFFSFYFFFTGIHLLHVLLGLGILLVVTRKFVAGHPAGPRLIEIGATYWHMVDLLWVMILALLYMMR
jgi:nitric oxide reductase NorE protein